MLCENLIITKIMDPIETMMIVMASRTYSKQISNIIKSKNKEFTTDPFSSRRLISNLEFRVRNILSYINYPKKMFTRME